MTWIRCDDGSLLDLEKFPLLLIRDRQGASGNDPERMELAAVGSISWTISKGSRERCEEVRNAVQELLEAIDPLAVTLQPTASGVPGEGGGWGSPRRKRPPHPPSGDEDHGHRAD